MVNGPTHNFGNRPDEPEKEEDRGAILEAAIRMHRFSVGRGYHYHTFKSVNAANLLLWSHVTDRSVYEEDTEDTPTLAQEAPLARPAMMEDTE
jgi:hypothetical protein